MSVPSVAKLSTGMATATIALGTMPIPETHEKKNFETPPSQTLCVPSYPSLGIRLNRRNGIRELIFCREFRQAQRRAAPWRYRRDRPREKYRGGFPGCLNPGCGQEVVRAPIGAGTGVYREASSRCLHPWWPRAAHHALFSQSSPLLRQVTNSFLGVPRLVLLLRADV
eukprot:669045-Rhodomonas_salina.2